MTHIKAPGSQALMSHELLKFNPSANIMSRLSQRGKSVIAIIKSLLKYSRTITWRYEEYLSDAHIGDIRKDLVSCAFLQGTAEATYRVTSM